MAEEKKKNGEKKSAGTKTTKKSTAKKQKECTCANSTEPNVSMEREIADVVTHESDMGEVKTPYSHLARYRMVTASDDNSTFSTSRS